MTEGSMSKILDEARESMTSEVKADLAMQSASHSEVSSSGSSHSVSSCREEHPRSQVQATNTNVPQVVSHSSVVSQDDFILTQLAKQLEYYFSRQNLAKDTYLQTLRNLNDGCVPVSILANFFKVKLLVPAPREEVRIQAVMQAAADYSTLLSIFLIDTTSGKIVNDSDKTPLTIPAVGPISQDELPSVSITEHLNQSSTVSNTIILRDVDPSVTEDEVRALFDGSDCPGISEVHRDVAFCWFISLDTDARDAMIQALQQLRTKTLAGEPVHARLKASTTQSAPVLEFFPVVPIPKKKKKKVRPRKKRRGRKKRDNSEAPSSASSLSLGEDEFPTLQDKKVEWATGLEVKTEAVEEDDEDDQGEEEEPKSKVHSDGASTATTTSSSTDSIPKKTLPAGGYAAALLKNPKQVMSEAVREMPSLRSDGASSVASSNAADDRASTSMLNRADTREISDFIQPPTWVGGRSFADVLRKEEATGCDSKTSQS